MATQPGPEFSGTTFLGGMPPQSRDQILVNSTKIRYPAGTIAFQPGDPDRADILDSGFARIYLSSSEGRQTTVRYVHPGELMGGLLVMGAPFDGSVQIVVEFTVTYLDLLAVRRRVVADAALGAAVAADLALRYSHAVRTIGLHAFGPSCSAWRSISSSVRAGASCPPACWRQRFPSRRSPTGSARPVRS